MELTKGDALQFVKAALESKAITLGGPGSGATTSEAGQKDAAYLMALLDALAKPPRQ